MPDAEADAAEIHALIAADSATNADRYIQQIRLKVASLARLPRRCPVAREESRAAGFQVRESIMGSYRVLFTLIGAHVVVLRIKHAARRRTRE
jgi:plasmid stabilization system protein ParE